MKLALQKTHLGSLKFSGNAENNFLGLYLDQSRNTYGYGTGTVRVQSEKRVRERYGYTTGCTCIFFLIFLYRNIVFY